jgi:flagellar biosynthesis/type III secretory pathway protein FliH
MLPLYYVEVGNMVYNLANTIDEMNRKAVEKGIKEGLEKGLEKGKNK